MNTRPSVQVVVNGHAVSMPADATVAAAVATVASCFRRSVNGEPRAPLCGMGVCFECRVRIDGMPHMRACMVPVRDGMQVCTDD